MDLSRIIDDQSASKRAIAFHGKRSPNTQLSYADLDGHIDAIAKTLLDPQTITQTTGSHVRLTPGDAVAIAAQNCVEHFVAYLAILRAGLVAVPINHQLSKSAIEHSLAQSEVKLIFSDNQKWSWLSCIEARVNLISDWPALLQTGAKLNTRLPNVDPNQVAVIMHTSGSTGMPKAVPITHNGYTWAMQQFSALRDTVAGQNVLIAAPLYHMNAQFHIKSVLQVGGTAILMERFSVEHFLDLIGQYKIVRVTGVPTMLALAVRALQEGYKAELGSVTSVAMGSAPFSKALYKQIQHWFPNAVITNGYGTTELGPGVFGVHPGSLPTPPLSVGYPLPEAQVKLVGPQAPRSGVLWVKNPMVPKGYLNNPQQNKKSFKDGWYITNDLMRVDDNGFYFFEDRADDMFVCGGENIYPADVERLLLTHDDVQEAAVVPVPDPLKAHLPVAFVVSPRELDVESLRNYTLEQGPPYAHPRAIFQLSQMPLGTTKKIDRDALKQLALEKFQR